MIYLKNKTFIHYYKYQNPYKVNKENYYKSNYENNYSLYEKV